MTSPLYVRYVTHDSGTLLHGLEKSFLQTEGPGGWTSYAFRDLYREIAAAGARVVMDGHGGDYTINPRGQRALARLLATGQWRQFITEFGPWRRHRRQTVLQTVKEDILYFLLLRPIVGPWRRFRRGLRPFGPTMPASRAFLLRMAAEGLAPDRAPGDARGAPMRAVSERVLRRQQNLATLSGSIVAAAHGLELTRPFHDKRVVELGLAVPEDLYVKNGRPHGIGEQYRRSIAPAKLAGAQAPQQPDRGR